MTELRQDGLPQDGKKMSKCNFLRKSFVNKKKVVLLQYDLRQEVVLIKEND